MGKDLKMDYKRPYIRAVLRCMIPTALTVAVNIVCLILRTDENHLLMLLINLLSDWICGLFLVYYVSCCVQPRKEMYRLSRRQREKIQGVIDKIETQPIRYERIHCVTVHVGQRYLFAPEEMPLPKEGETVTFYVAGNVILEVTK